MMIIRRTGTKLAGGKQAGQRVQSNILYIHLSLSMKAGVGWGGCINHVLQPLLKEMHVSGNR